MEKQQTDIDFIDDVKFYKSARVVKLFIVVLMLLMVAAALAGFAGYGKWTKMNAGNSQDVFIEYERFLRASRETPMSFRINTAGADSMVRLTLSSAYFEKVALRQIVPQPAKTSVGNGSYTLWFPVHAGQTTETVTLFVMARKAGKNVLSASSGKNNYTVSQFIYP